MVTSAAVPLGEEPLRIAVVAPPWYEVPPHGYGGVEALCGALVEMLLLRGHDVTLIGAGEPGTAARFLRTYQEPQYERLGQVMPELVHAAAVNRLLASGDFDVIHDHTASGPLTAALRRAPTVVTVHGPVEGELGDFYQSLGDVIHLVAISDAQRRCRPSLAWAATVHNSVRVEQFPYQARKGSYVLWLARFCQEKGPELAVKACREAGLPLVLVGKCSEPAERSYLAEVVRPLVSPDVEIVLNADRERILELLAGARCLLLPLRWPEPFGMVMIEAMACGTPVVALDSGSVPEIVRPGVTGLICADTAELPEALHAVTAISPSACREHVRRSFSAELMAERYEHVYRATVASARRVFPALERPPIGTTERGGFQVSSGKAEEEVMPLLHGRRRQRSPGGGWGRRSRSAPYWWTLLVRPGA